MTRREAFARAGRNAPYVAVRPELRVVLDVFWRVKRFCAELTDPISPGLLRDYCADQGVILSQFERKAVYALDYEIRTALTARRAENDKYLTEKGRNK